MADNIFKRILQPGGRGKLWWMFTFILLLAIGGGLIVGGSYYNTEVDKLAAKTKNVIMLPHVKAFDFHLGLDLLGGSRLVYKADESSVAEVDKSSALEGVRDVIERRVNVFGVSEPVVTTNRSGGDYQVIVELAGIKDINQAIKMLGETPLLEFKEMNTQKRTLTADEQKSLDAYNAQAEKRATDVLGKVISGGDFAALAKQFSEDTTSNSNGGDLGWVDATKQPEIVSIASKLKNGETTKDIAKTSEGYEIVKLTDTRIKTDPFDNQQEKEVKAAHLLICYNGIDGCTSGLSEQEALDKITKLKAQATPANFSQLVKDNSTEPGARTSGGELGWFGRGKMVKEFEDVVFPMAKGTISNPVKSQFGYHLIYKEDERVVNEYRISNILIKTRSAVDIIGNQSDWVNTELTGKNLSRASVQFSSRDNSPEVSLEFDDQGAKMFEDITSRNVGKQVAIYLDGYAISSPTVNEKITGGKAVITGRFSITEAKLLAQRLNAGALPVPITLINQQTVGATLGHDSLVASLDAGLYAFALVAIFMILFYRFPGLLAVFSLSIYTLLVLSVFKLWPVTLTLSGLAGFIMSIGMAVDANVLIFARLREELHRGRPLGLALEEAFHRAWPSIRDSNSFTIMTSIILIIFTTSVVKGFAVTLIVGVIISMFSAIVITRTFLRLIPVGWLENKNWLIGVKKTEDKIN